MSQDVQLSFQTHLAAISPMSDQIRAMMVLDVDHDGAAKIGLIWLL